jgi:hypothetical protein
MKRSVALLDEQAAKQGAMLAIERVDGHWRAGFAALDRLGEYVITQRAYGPDRSAALRQLLALAEARKN